MTGLADPPAAAATLLVACVEAACLALLAAEAELSALDRAIGDGDHGSNVARAARTLLDSRDELAALSPGKALEHAGMIVAMRVGGASGPLYGSLLMGAGRAWPEGASLRGIAAAFAAGVEAAARRGRAKAGDKTMLDVLAPAAQALADGAGGALADALAAMVAAADAGLEATRPLQAARGRAAFVGARAIGHLDPGAASARMILAEVARVGAAHGGQA